MVEKWAPFQSEHRFTFFVDDNHNLTLQTNGGDFSSGAPSNQWINFAMRRTRDDFMLFINQTNRVSTSWAGTNLDSTESLKFGRHLAGAFMDGRLDEVHLFKRALSDTEMLDIQGSSDGLCIPSPACGTHWLDAGERCDDGNLVDGDGCDSNCTATASRSKTARARPIKPAPILASRAAL